MSQFKKWKCRASAIGHLCTNREKITKKQFEDIKILEDEKKTGVNVLGNKVSWTPTKATRLKELIEKRDAPEVLPEGVKTHLDNIFRSEFWGRKRLLFNKYLDKGNLCEQDSLDLVSHIDKFFYQKNDKQFENSFISGEPDNIQGRVKDVKTNFDMDSFDNADISELYKWQVKGYIWLLISELKIWNGELIYCLVNSPYHQFLSEKTSLYYQMGMPSEEDERWLESVQQLEKNVIFDVDKWKEVYPGHDFYNTDQNFSIPPIIRIKRHDITLTTQDIKFMKERVKMARIYLINKEKDVLKTIKQT